MGRARSVGVELPEGVQAVRKPSGKTYYYFAPKRSTKMAGGRVALGSDPRDPDFWRRLRAAQGHTSGAKTFDTLIAKFKESQEFARLRDATQRDYTRYLDTLSIQSGDRLVAALTRADAYQLRDDMKATPVAANHMLSVLQTLVEFGIPYEFSVNNPVMNVKRLTVEGTGASPWPDAGHAFVLARAPADIRRAAFLGRATGQRASDLVRMKPKHLQSDGITVWIGKLREKEHFVPLTAVEIAEIKSWDVSPLDLFIKSTRNKPYTATHLNSRWNRWRDSDEAKPIAAITMTLHGLRATKISDLSLQGLSDRSIADELGMSVQMVGRYLRFADKTKAARESRDRREAVFKLSDRSRSEPALSGTG